MVTYGEIVPLNFWGLFFSEPQSSTEEAWDPTQQFLTNQIPDQPDWWINARA